MSNMHKTNKTASNWAEPPKISISIIVTQTELLQHNIPKLAPLMCCLIINQSLNRMHYKETVPSKNLFKHPRVKS